MNFKRSIDLSCTPIIKKVFVLCSFLIGLSAWGKDHKTNEPSPGYFNSRILSEGTWSVSTFGNFNIGVNENLELGTNLYALYLGYLPNISIKHRMFKTGNWELSFNSHTFMWINDQIQNIHAGYGLFATYNPSVTKYFNFGLFKVNSIFNNLDEKSTDYIEYYYSYFGYDYMFSNSWTISGLAFFSLWHQSQSSYETIDFNAQTKPLIQSPNAPPFFALNFEKRYDNIDFSLGIIDLYWWWVPYLQITWRWQ